MSIAGFILIRHLILSLGAYIFGKCARGVNFDLKIYQASHLKGLFFNGFMAVIAKTLQYASFAMIPLTLSSCIIFSSSTWFAALIALIIIKETLSIGETVRMVLSMIGVLMITMPQLFSFMDPDAAKVKKRLDEELK